MDKLVYRATVTDENQNVETYTGLTGNTFKKRYYGHSHSFREQESEHATTLSAHIWKLKKKKKKFDVKWEVVAQAVILSYSTPGIILYLDPILYLHPILYLNVILYLHVILYHHVIQILPYSATSWISS